MAGFCRITLGAHLLITFLIAAWPDPSRSGPRQVGREYGHTKRGYSRPLLISCTNTRQTAVKVTLTNPIVQSQYNASASVYVPDYNGDVDTSYPELPHYNNEPAPVQKYPDLDIDMSDVILDANQHYCAWVKFKIKDPNYTFAPVSRAFIPVDNGPYSVFRNIKRLSPTAIIVKVFRKRGEAPFWAEYHLTLVRNGTEILIDPKIKNGYGTALLLEYGQHR